MNIWFLRQRDIIIKKISNTKLYVKNSSNILLKTIHPKTFLPKVFNIIPCLTESEMTDLKFWYLDSEVCWLNLKSKEYIKHIYIYIYMSWVQVILDIILNNVTPLNNLLLNYFESPIVELHVLYVLNIHANFHINQILFTIWSINSFFYALF